MWKYENAYLICKKSRHRQNDLKSTKKHTKIKIVKINKMRRLYKPRKKYWKGKNRGKKSYALSKLFYSLLFKKCDFGISIEWRGKHIFKFSKLLEKNEKFSKNKLFDEHLEQYSI